MDQDPGEITQLLRAAHGGDTSAGERLYERVYTELRQLARRWMSRERPGHTLQPTALVNEAYLRLTGGDASWANRAHFFGAAAEAMRRVLIEHARRKSAEKRGAGQGRVTLEDLDVRSEEPHVDLLALDRALDALTEADARLTLLVKLRYFVGLTIEETAEVLQVSPATVKRDWTYARAWLREHMSS